MSALSEEVWDYVDVSMEEMREGRPPKRRLYQWPICALCWNHLQRPELSVPRRLPSCGPAPARRAAGHNYEICSLCGRQTITGIYLKWLSPAGKPDLEHYMSLRVQLVQACVEEVDEDSILDNMDPAWKKMTSDERLFVESLPQIKVW